MKTKAQISFAVTAKLISDFVFTTRIEQFLFFLKKKFQSSRLFLKVYRPVCVRPGRKPQRPVFSRRGSYINNPGHMTKMAIYGKNSSKTFFSRTGELISRKLGMNHRWLKYYNVYINHDPVMTLTQGQHGLPMHLNGNNC